MRVHSVLEVVASHVSVSVWALRRPQQWQSLWLSMRGIAIFAVIQQGNSVTCIRQIRELVTTHFKACRVQSSIVVVGSLYCSILDFIRSLKGGFLVFQYAIGRFIYYRKIWWATYVIANDVPVELHFLLIGSMRKLAKWFSNTHLRTVTNKWSVSIFANLPRIGDFLSIQPLYQIQLVDWSQTRIRFVWSNYFRKFSSPQ